MIDYYLSQNRDEATAKAFMNKTIAKNGLPNKMIINGSKSDCAALDSINVQLWLTGFFMLNNIVEQSHRWVNQKTRQALGWKSIEGATASLHGREMWTMLKSVVR